MLDDSCIGGRGRIFASVSSTLAGVLVKLDDPPVNWLSGMDLNHHTGYHARLHGINSAAAYQVSVPENEKLEARVGFEPTSGKLTASCSSSELPSRNWSGGGESNPYRCFHRARCFRIHHAPDISTLQCLGLHFRFDSEVGI